MARRITIKMAKSYAPDLLPCYCFIRILQTQWSLRKAIFCHEYARKKSSSPQRLTVSMISHISYVKDRTGIMVIQDGFHTLLFLIYIYELKLTGGVSPGWVLLAAFCHRQLSATNWWIYRRWKCALEPFVGANSRAYGAWGIFDWDF